MKINEKQKGIIALILLAFFYASVGLFSRYMNISFRLFQQVYLRILSGFIIGLILFRKDLDFSKLKTLSIKEWLLLFFRSFSYYLLGVVLFTKAVILAKYSNVSFIGALPMTAVLGFFLTKEKVTRQKIFYILLASFGVIIIAVKDYVYVFNWGFGEILTLLSVFFVSISYVLRKWHSHKLTNKEITQITLAIAFIGIFITSILTGEGLPINNWSWVMFLVVILAGIYNVLVIFLLNYGFNKVEASFASNILSLEMIFAVMVGFAFYRELPNLKEMAGGILILISVIQMNKLNAR